MLLARELFSHRDTSLDGYVGSWEHCWLNTRRTCTISSINFINLQDLTGIKKWMVRTSKVKDLFLPNF